MQAALQVAPLGVLELVAISGLSTPVVRRYLNELHSAKMVHIGDWGRDSRGYPTIRKYLFGTAPDAVCPTVTPAERMRAARAAKKAGAK